MVPSPISQAPTSFARRPATGVLRRCNAVVGKSDSGNPFSSASLGDKGVAALVGVVRQGMFPSSWFSNGGFPVRCRDRGRMDGLL